MASRLDELLKNIVNPQQGRVPTTKDYGVTEFLGIGSKIPSQYQLPYNVATDLLGNIPQGQVKGDSTYSPNMSPWSPTGGQTPTGGNIYGGGTGTGFGGYQAPNTDAQKDTAEDIKESDLERIQKSMDSIYDLTNDSIDQYGRLRDEAVSNIGQTYGGLQESAKQKVGTTLENLGQERVGVYDTYGTAKGESRRALESAITKNRMLARAMNRLNSSFYDDRQAEASETGARNIGGLAREEAGKIAGIGTRETESKNWGEQTALAIQQEQASLEQEARKEYENSVRQATAIRDQYGIDSVAEIEEAENRYRSSLSAIDQYVQSVGLQIAQIMATNASAMSSNISNYAPDLGFLMNNSELGGLEDIETFQGATNTGANPGNLVNQGVQQDGGLDELLKRLGIKRS